MAEQSDKTRCPPICWVRQNAAPPEFDPELSEAAFSAVSSNFCQSRPQVAGEAISVVAVDLFGVDVLVK